MITLDKPYTYEMILGEMQRQAENRHRLLSFHIIGKSHDDRWIPMCCMGYGERVLICTAGVHGRESVNPVILLKMIEEYGRGCEEGRILAGRYDLQNLFKQFSICFIPLVNPDGYEIALRGFSAIRNPKLRQAQRMRMISPECWKYNARGVDINRNFPCESYIRQQYFDYPASENETKALIRVFQLFPSAAYVDFHSRGKVIYYYRRAMSRTYNQKNYHLARQLQSISHYALGKKEEELLTAASGGNTVHYYSEATGAPAITVETVDHTADFPLKIRLQTDAYEEVKYIPLEVLSYLTP